jgi:hypothetical protein
MYKQLVMVEFRNCSPFIYNVVSDKPITLDGVVEYFISTEDFNEERDSITFLDELTTINLDDLDNLDND